MTKVWKIGFKFDPTTGAVNAYEGWNHVYENGKLVNVVRWGSYKTEAAAIKGLTKKVARCQAEPIFVHDGKTIEYVGNMGA